MLRDSYAEHKKEELDAERASRRSERRRMEELEKVRMANYLTSIGYEVTSLSQSPFSLLAASKYYSFFADVKYRDSRGGYPVEAKKIDSWLTYKRPDTQVNDRIVIICTPGRRDSFVSVSDIHSFYTLKDSYVIPRESMKSLVIIRKILEHSYRDDTHYSLKSYS